MGKMACAAYGCNNRTTRKSREQLDEETIRKITFHRFPKDQARRDMWISAVHLQDWTPFSYSVLCSQHFTEDCFDKTSLCVVRLKDHAVPSIFPAFPTYFRKTRSSSVAGLGEDEDTKILAKPFEQVLLTAQEEVKDELLVKEEIDIFDGIVEDSCQQATVCDTHGGNNQQREDDACREGVDPCVGTTHAPAETVAGNSKLVEEEITFEDGLLFSGDTFTGTASSNELLQKERVCTLFEEDAKLCRLKETSNLDFPTQLEISSSDFKRNYFQPAQLISYKTFPSDTVEDKDDLHRSQKRFSCSVCSATFSFKCGLKLHMRVHTGEKPFSCLFCLKAFIRKDTWENHVRTHTGEKPFSCALCPAKFACKSSLAAHKKKHTGEKPYTCSLCSLKFCRKASLEIHCRIHTGEKPFSCPLCAAKFTQRGHMYTHMRKHTGEKPFSCSLCSTKFSNKSGMNKHLRTVHCLR